MRHLRATTTLTLTASTASAGTPAAWERDEAGTCGSGAADERHK